MAPAGCRRDPHAQSVYGVQLSRAHGRIEAKDDARQQRHEQCNKRDEVITPATPDKEDEHKRAQAEHQHLVCGHSDMHSMFRIACMLD